jgi:hypothetical protein
MIGKITEETERQEESRKVRLEGNKEARKQTRKRARQEESKEMKGKSKVR